MKKTLLALALSTLPLAAAAEVTLYGDIKGGLEYTKVDHFDNSVTDVNDWGSYIGFRGEEELSGGLKAIWQIEQKISLDHNSPKNSRWADRESFIGLSGAFGTLRAGYLEDTFKSDLEALDPWQGNGIRTLANYTRFGGRYTGVRYDSPNWSGFSFNVLYSPEDNNRLDQARRSALAAVVEENMDENNGGFEGLTGVVNTVTKYSDVLSVGLGYENAGWFAHYGYKNIRNAEVSGGGNDLNGEVHGLEVGYDDGTIFAGLGARNSRNLVSGLGGQVGSNWENTEGALTFAYTAGNLVPRISVSYGEEKERHSDNPVKNKYDQIIAGLDYNLSKRTAVLASLGYWTNKPKSWTEVRDQVTDNFRSDSNKKYKSNRERIEAYSFGLGLRHRF